MPVAEVVRLRDERHTPKSHDFGYESYEHLVRRAMMAVNLSLSASLDCALSGEIASALFTQA